MTYKTIQSASTATFRDRGSKFIAYAYPIAATEDNRQILQALKEEHPKAVHYCYAYRLGTDGNNFRAADDGEPSGSAGKPILGQIDSAGLTNVLIVVVRYFGGTLLGVPGLINAYKTAAHDALAEGIVIEKQVERNLRVEFDYTMLNEVMRILKQHHIDVIRQELNLFCTIEVSIPISHWEQVKGRLTDLRGVIILEDQQAS